MGGLFGAEHVWTVVVIAGATAALVAAARLRPGPWTQVAARALAVVLIGDEVAWWIYLVVTHANRADLLYALPFQLCDAAIFISAAALWSRRQILVEVTYFWGLAGTIQAIITPDLPQHFPTFPFIQYYVAHGGVVAAGLFLVVGLGQWPRRRAVIGVAALTIVYAAFVGLLDLVTGADYMYLRAKPASATLLDLLGPWPWYIGWATLIGIALFVILDAPFAISRKWSADRITGRVPR
ncbi:MAG: TIGR02206 family membrane protein [Chloroflexi bacterium]|nr:MAG: TIGR02206 family membrane protein [Chloroflexota bacterium]